MKKILKSLVIACVFGLTFIALFDQKKSTDSLNVISQSEVVSDENVLSDRSRVDINISADRDSYQSGGVVALSSVDEPVLNISSYNGDGKEATFEFYKANKKSLLTHLIYNNENKQIYTEPDQQSLQFVTSFSQRLSSDSNSNTTKITLPLDETGIWYVRVRLGESSQGSFVIRSNIGVVAKEGNDQFIFWAQNFKTHRSHNSGVIRTYSMNGFERELSSSQLNQEGISVIDMNPEVDIVLLEDGNDISLVPMNLPSLGSGYRYARFEKKRLSSKYFIFTDRPLYKPGDTIYFKSIVRNEDDVRYFIPQVLAEVKIYSGNEKDPIFDKKIQVSNTGTINGEFVLPETAKTGYYTLSVKLPPTQTQTEQTWWEENTIGFEVEYFRKPEYFIDINASKTEIISGDKLDFSVSGSFFSGNPLTGKKVKFKVYASKYYDYEYLTDSQRPDTDDYRYYYWGSKSILENEAELDEGGNAIVSVDTKQYPSEGENRIFTIESEYDDGSGNPSFSRKNILVYAGEYGIYRQNSTYTRSVVGKEYRVPYVLKQHRNTNISNISVKAKINREWWEPYREENKKYPSYRKISDPTVEKTFVTNNQGEFNFTFTPQQSGSYKIFLESKDKLGNPVNRELFVWVSAENETYYSETNSSINIIGEQKTYIVGETTRLNVSSQIPDRDLFVTTERGRVDSYQVLHLNGGSGVFDLQIKDEFIPNMYVNAVSFSAFNLDQDTENLKINSDSKKILVNLTPDRSTYGPGDTVRVGVSTKDIQGNPISAETAVWAVDKSLFELVAQDTRKIFDTFWHERYISTSQAHSLEGIYISGAEQGGGCFSENTLVLMQNGSNKPIKDIKPGEFVLTRSAEDNAKLVSAKVIDIHKEKSTGFFVINQSLEVTSNHILYINGSWQEASTIEIGDSLIDSQNRTVRVNSLEWQNRIIDVYNLEIKDRQTFFAGDVWVHNQKGGGARSVFKDTAYWNPVVTTDSSGEAIVTFKLPDNLTTWVLSGIGSTTDTKVGQTIKEIAVTKNLVVRPVLPNILREGDEIFLSAFVHNFTDNDHNFDVSLGFDAGVVETATHAGVMIKANDTKQFHWKVNPTIQNPKSTLIYTAKSDKDKSVSDTVVQTIPVKAFGFLETRGENGSNDHEFSIQLAEDTSVENSEITLSLAPTLTASLPEGSKYLLDYPYGCVEQTTSRFVPLIIAKANPTIFADVTRDKDIDAMIKKGISRLVSLQANDGGWSWWNSGKSDYFITAYVVEYLTLTKQSGVQFDDSILDQAYSFLKNEITTSTNQNTNVRDLNVARQYGLSFYPQTEGKALISDFSGMTPDVLSLAVLANIRNGFSDNRSNGLEILISLAKNQGDSMFWSEGTKTNFGSIDASTALAVRAILAGDGDLEVAQKAVRFLVNSKKLGYWSNSFATAQVLHAGIDFARKSGELIPNFAYNVKLDGIPLDTGLMSDPTTNKLIKIPAAKLSNQGSILKVESVGEGQLYSTLIVKELRTDKKAARVGRGIQVTKRLTNEKGDNYNISVGDIVSVEISVYGLTAPESYGIIEDELPSGLIPINVKFDNEQYGAQEDNSIYRNQYSEVTENGMVMPVYSVPDGQTVYRYKARVVSSGAFTVPPAFIALMYSPEVYARSDIETLTVSEESVYTPPEFENIDYQIRSKLLENKTALYVIFISILVALFLFRNKIKKVIYKILKKPINTPKPPTIPKPPVQNT